MAEPRFFGGRYELGEMLGHGGMAEVRIGVDRRLGRTVAVKVLRADLATDPTFQARFRREAQSAAALNHPAIVAVYDTGEEVVDGVAVPYIVMEYVEGRTLRDVLREGRRILPERAMEITADVLEALDYSHRAGIIHRDIKPGNVMLTPSGDVKVMDFGIARAVADASATMTQTAAVIGTAQYLSPEQARGETVDSRSDIYSTGCLLYELLTGRPPFVGDSPVSVAYQHVREEPRPPSMLDPEVTPEADAITLKALRKKPHDRYQSADEMRNDIVRALSGQRVSAAPAMAPAPPMPSDATARFMPPPGPQEDPRGQYGPPYDEYSQWDDEPPPPGNRRKATWIALAVAAVLILGIGGWLLWQMFGPPSTVAVPDLEGKTVEEARVALQERQLRLGEADVEAHDTVPKDRIIGQSPGAAESVEPGSVVDVVVSGGVANVQVPPNLVGSNIKDVEKRLRDAGFTVSKQEDGESEKPKGEVLSTDPAPGQTVAKGTDIKVVYSAGNVQVPDVRTETRESAEARLKAAGLKVKTVVETSDEEPGKVFKQIPVAKEWVKRGTEVTIFIPREVKKPDLSLEVTAPEQVQPGQSAAITASIQNRGEGDTSEPVTLQMKFPTEAVQIGALPQGCDVQQQGNEQIVTCTIQLIEAGDTEQVAFDVTIGLLAPGTTIEGPAGVQTEGDEEDGNNADTYRMTVAGQ